MTDDILLIGTNERVRTLTLNRPQSRNALSSALRDRFFGALTDAETDDGGDDNGVPDSLRRNIALSTRT